MEMTIMRPLAALALVALAGCASEDSTRSSAFSELGSSIASFVGGRGAEGEGVTLSDAELNAAPVNVILLDIPEFGSEVGLVPQAQNRDVSTWVTPEGYSVSLKGGQIVGTAGFGYDLSSAEVPDLAAGARQVVRDHYRLQGDETVQRFRYFCDLSYTAGEEVVVTSRRFATIRIDESCESAEGETFDNIYWVDGVGAVRKSRQFVSPRLGYFELRDVHTGLR
ncbi:YjbF family lipoprotein [Palleronia sp. LCG004]|uniref:YjbF family lipoprotein n=1 Tax=Palleronia sp. LCG004 TaxID=3079304 RepID=UPI0029427FDF|nr:YjbF family lipoprotein [Palleronia sp. LCG004]WOI57370.1 YjbF family lipoprotein [Palleronia sp. LCG004]